MTTEKMNAMTITEFLLARITEDEEAANYANTGVRWESWNRSWDTEPQRDIAGGGVRLFTVPEMYDEHVARHDPARALAECKAKRRIVELHPPRWQEVERSRKMGEDEVRVERVAGPFYDEELRILASVYANHPEYDQDWRA